jgi:bifunctional DNA-binding transcriptional regulator/antitoxin component of YhaV-PrlF toxin-antitoxin module
MSTSSVPPVVPRAIPEKVGTGPGSLGRARRPLPLPALSSEFTRTADTAYALSAVDKSGRIADRSIIRALGWTPETRLDIREQSGVILVRATADGVHRIDNRGYMLLPLTVRRWCRLKAGDRVLLVANLSADVLAAHPLAVLDRLLAGAHSAMKRGETA